MNRDAVFSLTLFITFYILVYLCDFAKRCPLSFRSNTDIARVQASVAVKKQAAWRLDRCQQRAQVQTYPWVGGFLVLCQNQGVGRGDFVTLIRVLCQKAAQSQIIFPVV